MNREHVLDHVGESSLGEGFEPFRAAIGRDPLFVHTPAPQGED